MTPAEDLEAALAELDAAVARLRVRAEEEAPVRRAQGEPPATASAARSHGHSGTSDSHNDRVVLQPLAAGRSPARRIASDSGAAPAHEHGVPWTRCAVRVGRFIAIAALCALLMLLAVGLAPHVAALMGIETGPKATPALSLRTLDGREITTDSLRGRVVLVNFWTTGCLICRVEMPRLQRMAERHRDAGLVVLGLSMDRGPEADVRHFLAARGIDYPVAIVQSEMERTFGGIRGYPTSFLLDREGRIRQRALGPLAMVSFEPAVRRLLAEAWVP